VLAALLALAGPACGEGTSPLSDLAPIPWSFVSHECGPSVLLTAGAVLGPPGARIGSMLPGRYAVRGAYDLTSAPLGRHTISLGFNGFYVTRDSNRAGENRDAMVPAGVTTGRFEVVQEILQWNSGPGMPIVWIYAGDTTGTALDCIEVHP
jgi:hypothetical protein